MQLNLWLYFFELWIVYFRTSLNPFNPWHRWLIWCPSLSLIPAIALHVSWSKFAFQYPSHPLQYIHGAYPSRSSMSQPHRGCMWQKSSPLPIKEEIDPAKWTLFMELTWIWYLPDQPCRICFMYQIKVHTCPSTIDESHRITSYLNHTECKSHRSSIITVITSHRTQQ